MFRFCLNFLFLLSLFSLSFSFYFNKCGSLKRSNNFLLAGNVPLVANGKRIEVPEGSSLGAVYIFLMNNFDYNNSSNLNLFQACTKLGLKVPYKCKKGECSTCTVSVGGVRYKACVAKVPSVPKLKSVLEKGLTVTVSN